MENKPKTHPHNHKHCTNYSKCSHLNLGWTELLVDELDEDAEVTGINGGRESNVSHFVVTTTSEVEFVEGLCCSCWNTWEFPFEFLCDCCSKLGCNLWFPIDIPSSCSSIGGNFTFCWGFFFGTWPPLEFLIFNISKVSTYFCTLFTFKIINYHQKQ